MRKLKLLLGIAALCGAFAAYACNNRVTLVCWYDGDQLGWDSPYNLGLSTCTTETHIFAKGDLYGYVSTVTTLPTGYNGVYGEVICRGLGEIYDNCLFTYHDVSVTASAGNWNVPTTSGCGS